MKKYVAISGLIFLLVSSAYAGGMEPVARSPILYTFVGAEGGYTWNDINGIKINTLDSGGDSYFDAGVTSSRNAGGSARVYAGLMRLIYRDALYFSGEVGWGYYGKTTLTLHYITDNPNSSNLNGSTLTDTFNGFDALIGLVYNQPRYDLFLKAGALLQNSNLNGHLIVNQPPNPNNNSFSYTNVGVKLTLPQTLPEIKVGGAYHVNENISVSATYAHAFGYATQVNVGALNCNNGTGANCTGGTISNTLANASVNPSMDIVMLGLQYRFA